MRFEINVPDTTSRQLKARLAKLTKRLSKHPELAEEFPLDEDEAIQRMFTPEVIAELESISAEVKAGAKTYTSDEVRDHMNALSKAWRGNPAT